jgi:hypothetical protein
MYFAAACLMFYIFMQVGHYIGKKNLESQYPFVIPLTGDPTKWSDDEKTVMALVLPKCKNENESGNLERMKTCWINHAAIIKDDGKYRKVLTNLLAQNSKKEDMLP